MPEYPRWLDDDEHSDFYDLPKEPPDSWLRETNLMAVFGMSEMEAAAEIILDDCCGAGTWYRVFGVRDFPENALTGFLQLLERGWLRSMFYSKNSFRVTPSFVTRVNEPRRYTNEHGGWIPLRKRVKREHA